MDFNGVVKGFARNGSRIEWFNLKTLGKGSYGVVCLVNLKLKPISIFDKGDRIFAVKSCLFQNSASVQNELKLLNQFVGCDSIVRCYGERFSIDGFGRLLYHLFLEYAPGGTLFDLMIKKYGGKIPECDARFYARMLVEGVRDIHERGYVHSDLKPENILVFPSDSYGSRMKKLKIADFGLVRRAGEGHIAKVGPWVVSFPGTSVYMPPEAVCNGRIDTSLDIWSLGCIVLEMITGKPLWEYKNDRDMALKLGLSYGTPKIPETLSSMGKDFLMKCFQRDPSRRWTADMLLCHPFLLSADCNWLPSQTKSLYYAGADQSFHSCKEQVIYKGTGFIDKLNSLGGHQIRVLDDALPNFFLQRLLPGTRLN